MNTTEKFSSLEKLMKEQGEVLQMITGGKSLSSVFEKLVSCIEEQSDGLIASVYCTDASSSRLYHYAGNNLPKEYIAAINGLPIGPEEGPCGTAAFTKKTVVVENIEESPLWEKYKAIALTHGLRSCSSTPLINKEGKVRGTIAVYYKTQKKPSLKDQQFITLLAHTALLAIEYKMAEEERNKNDEHQKLITENILKSEQRFQNLVREASVGIVVLLGEEMIVDVVNEMYGKLINKTPEELLNKPLFDVIPDAEDPFRSLLDNVRTSGETIYLYDQPYSVSVDGKDIFGYLNLVYQPYKEYDGTITGVMALCHDVTEQVKARKKVEESEQRIRSVIEGAPFPIGIYEGREMRIQFANQSIIDAWGKGNDVIGKLYSHVLPELESQQIYQQLDDVFTNGIPFHASNQRVDLLVNDVLQSYYFNYSFTPLYNADGDIYGVMNTAADVTELAIAYNKVEESEERARLAIEASEQGTFQLDLRTNELVTSLRMSQIFEVEMEASSDRNRYVSAIHPDDLSIREKAFKTAYQNSILDYEVRVVKKDGSLIWIKVKGKIYFDTAGKPLKLFGIVQDITEQKKFSELLELKVEERTIQIEKANKQLTAINEELQQFAYVSSHDLQEPLRKIRFYCDLLNRYLELESKQGQYIQKINSSAERMSGLIQSLLEYSRVSNNKTRFERIDLNDLLNFILTDYELLIEQKGAVIHIDKLPRIEGMTLQMNQLFYNLIGNALKFTRRGAKPIITVKSEPLSEERKSHFPELKKEKEYLVISVEDNGIGFEQSYASKIFTVFQRLNDRSSFGGFGIGLALCQKVTLAHQGIIFAEGELKKGAKFTVILPIHQ